MAVEHVLSGTQIMNLCRGGSPTMSHSFFEMLHVWVNQLRIKLGVQFILLDLPKPCDLTATHADKEAVAAWNVRLFLQYVLTKAARLESRSSQAAQRTG